MSKYSTYIFIMTEDSTKKLLELYNLMEEKLEELNLNFDEFHVLYRNFRNPPAPPKGNDHSNPFPWVKSAGTVGWK